MQPETAVKNGLAPEPDGPGKVRRNPPFRAIPLRVLLIVPFVLLIALAVASVGYLSFRNGQQAVNAVAQQVRGELTARIRDHLGTFLDVPHRINRINDNAMRQGLLDVGDPDALERHFWEQIRVFESVTSIYFGNTAGGLVNAGREGAAGDLYVIATDRFAGGPFRKYATDAQRHRTALLATVPDFDARTRPWYTGAVEKGDAFWSEVYILFTGQDMAIAASRPVYDERRNLLGVVSVDLFLYHLSSFLQNLHIGETGEAFVMERSGLLLASSAAEKPFTRTEGNRLQRRLHASEIANPAIHFAAKALEERFGNHHRIEGAHHLSFKIDGHRHFLQVSPVGNEHGLDWLIGVVIPESDFMAGIRKNNRTTVFLIFASLAMAITAGILAARGITRPIIRLNASAQTLSKGEWTRPLTENGYIAETGELTRSFNRMAGRIQAMVADLTAENAERRRAEKALRKSHFRLQETLAELTRTQEKMVQQERLAAVGQLAAGIAHDFNNILAGILGYAELVNMSPNIPPSLKPHLEKIIASAQRAAHLVRQILDFSRKSIRQPKPLDLALLIREAVQFFEHTIPETIRMSLEIEAGEYRVEADATQVRQMLMNLVLNARDAMPEGGELRVRLFRIETHGEIVCIACDQPVNGDWIAVSVSDNGAGIAPEVLPRIFEPFFTTKGIGRGTGLGLSQVLGIIQQHGGHFTVDSGLGRGTAFTGYLPPLTGKRLPEQK